jgi:multidrug efflux pump subunit AcrB
VILDKDKMAENGIDPMGIIKPSNNSSSPSASFVNQDEEYLTGKFLTSADDVENLVVGLNKK